MRVYLIGLGKHHAEVHKRICSAMGALLRLSHGEKPPPQAGGAVPGAARCVGGSLPMPAAPAAAPGHSVGLSTTHRPAAAAPFNVRVHSVPPNTHLPAVTMRGDGSRGSGE